MLTHDETHVNASCNATHDKRGSHVNYKYSNKDRPPFVQVQPVDDARSSSLHPLHMNRDISQIFPRDVVEIRKTGRSKITIEMRNYDAANKLVTSEQLVAHKLRAFISIFRVLRAGVIRNVPQDFSLEAVKELTSSLIKILEFHRLNRRVKLDGEVKYLKYLSRTVCIKFAGQFLPQYVNISNCRYSVSPFIPKKGYVFHVFALSILVKHVQVNVGALTVAKPVIMRERIVR